MRFPGRPFWATLPLATLGSFFLFTSLREATFPMDSGSVSQQVPKNRSAYIEDEIVIAPEEMDPRVAVRSAVEWLLRHQFMDGMWSTASYMRMCPKEICGGAGRDKYDYAVTALALWALLDSGLVHEPPVWEAAKEALAWLKLRQEETAEGGGGSMYGQAISAIAFCRAFEVLADPYARVYAKDGIRWMEKAQNQNGGWGYHFQDGRSDSSVTAWVSHALLYAGKIEIEISPLAKRGSLGWFDGVTDSRYYQVSYRRKGEGGSALRGRNEWYEQNGALTALATMIRLEWGVNRHDPRIREAVRNFSWNLPVWNRSRSSVDFTYWYGGTMAMEAAGKQLRDLWRNRIRSLLGRYQEVRGCRAGSWNPEDKWGCEGGRVYATALNILTLVRAGQ